MRGLVADGASHPLHPSLDAVSLLAAVNRARPLVDLALPRVLRPHVEAASVVMRHTSGVQPPPPDFRCPRSRVLCAEIRCNVRRARPEDLAGILAFRMLPPLLLRRFNGSAADAHRRAAYGFAGTVIMKNINKNNSTAQRAR